MQRVIFLAWQNIAFRLIVGWGVVVILPALLMWRMRFLQGRWLITEFNSMVLATLGVLLVTLGLRKLTEFSGQRSISFVLPTLLLVMMLLGMVIIVFFFFYLLYYFGLSGVIGAVFFFLSFLLEQKAHQPYMAYIPLGHCQNFEAIFQIRWLRLEKPHLDAVQSKKVQAIVADLSSPALDEDWQRFLTEQTLQGRPVYNNRQVYESLTGRLPIHHLYENELGSLLPSQTYLWFKQLLDIIAILLVAPFVLLIAVITVIAIRLESPGKAIFVQERVGQGGKLFKIYKFRSMRFDSEKNGAKLAQQNDPRVTKVGKFIRKTRIDELPQFLNVLKGDMSLIGPRPEQLSFVKTFEKTIPFYNYRHIVKPGISGWAQVTQGYASDTDETALKVQYDFYYIKHISFALDILIVLKTIQTMLTGFGAR